MIKVYNYINKDIKISSDISVMTMLAAAIVVWMACAGVGAAADEVEVTFEGHFGGITSAVAVSGNYAFISQGPDFVVLDISDPAIPLELSRLVTDDLIEDITASGDYAYVVDIINGLVIVDISNKNEPVFAGSYDTEGYARGVSVSGDYAYVADGGSGLVIIDISNKNAPVLAGSYDTAGRAYGVSVSGDYAYVADYGNGLVIVDISNKNAPVLAG
ncbi:MAG: hypothetical protein K8R25_12565, partial [Methanosarcinales archaeon]|nr:hypothetical protein [Methanosarcinales archaeon]